MKSSTSIDGLYRMQMLLCLSGIAFASTFISCGPRGNDMEVVKNSVIKIFSFDEAGQPLGTGTGFFINDSTVMTNHHVVGKAAILFGQNEATGKFRLTPFEEPQSGCDVQLLLSSKKSGAFIDVSAMAKLNLGAYVTVLGHPVGLPLTLSNGIVSSEQDREGLFQISAAISPGSSGSPVLSEDGFLIGVATASITGQSLNFATGVDCLQGYLGFARLDKKIGEYHLAQGGSSTDLEVTSVRQLPNYTELTLRTLSLNLPYIDTYYWYEESHLLVKGSERQYQLVDSDLPTDRANAISVGLGEELIFTARFERVPSLQGMRLVDDYDSWNIEEILVDDLLDLSKITEERSRHLAVLNEFDTENLFNTIEPEGWERMNNVDLERSMLLGVRLYLDDDMETAASVFKAITQARPSSNAFSNLWRVYHDGETEEDQKLALEAITRAVQLEPESSDLLKFKLWAMESNNLYNQDLIDEAEKLIRLDKARVFERESHWSRLIALDVMGNRDDLRYCESMRRVWYANPEQWKKDWINGAAWRCSWD